MTTLATFTSETLVPVQGHSLQRGSALALEESALGRGLWSGWGHHGLQLFRKWVLVPSPVPGTLDIQTASCLSLSSC